MQIKTISDRRLIPQTRDPQQFLSALGGPARISIKGRDSQRTRAFCTLLHGNEPSGLQALTGYLQSGQVPAVNIEIIIAAAETALTHPPFSHRMLPGRRDLNRCFHPPFEGEDGELAGAILDILQTSQPECLIDMHNTSGSGPAFGVAITNDADHLALTSLWTNDLIMTDLRLGALMELSEMSVPTVTIECGGANDRTSLMIAEEGLQRYFQHDNVMAEPGSEYGVSCYHNPIRMELKAGATIAYQSLNLYQDDFNGNHDVTLPLDADRLNYGSVPPGEPVAWLGPMGIDALTAKDHLGNEKLHRHFVVEDGKLLARHPLKLFMVTTNTMIAEQDCLFYFLDCGSC